MSQTNETGTGTGNGNNGASLNPVGTETQVNLVGTENKVNPGANGVKLLTDGTVEGGPGEGGPQSASPATNRANENAVVEEKMTIDNLQEKINNSITNLKTKLTDASGKIDFKEGDDIEAICTTLSGLNLLGEFDKELYSSLNKYFDDSYNTIQVDGIDLRVRGSLSQLMYSKIINGKVGDDKWPSEAQKEVFKQSLKGPGMLSSMGMGSWLGSPSKNPSAPTEAETIEGANSKGGPSAQGKDEDKDEDKGGEEVDGQGQGGEGEDNTEANPKSGGKRIIKRKRKFLKKK